MPTLKDLMSLTQTFTDYMKKLPPSIQEDSLLNRKTLVLEDERISLEEQALLVLALDLSWEAAGLREPPMSPNQPAKDILERRLGMSPGGLAGFVKYCSNGRVLSLRRAWDHQGPR